MGGRAGRTGTVHTPRADLSSRAWTQDGQTPIRLNGDEAVLVVAMRETQGGLTGVDTPVAAGLQLMKMTGTPTPSWQLLHAPSDAVIGVDMNGDDAAPSITTAKSPVANGMLTVV